MTTPTSADSDAVVNDYNAIVSKMASWAKFFSESSIGDLRDMAGADKRDKLTKPELIEMCMLNHFLVD